MTNYLYQNSLFSSVLKIFITSNVYESKIINSFLKHSNLILHIISLNLKKSRFMQYVLRLPWKPIILFTFILSLSITPDSGVQLSTFASTSRVDLSQKQFGIVLFSFSNILLLPLIIIFIRQYSSGIKFKLQNFEMFLLAFIIISQVSIVTGINITSSSVWFLKLIYGLSIYVIFSRISLTKKQITLVLFALTATIFLEGFLIIPQYLKGGLLGLPFENAQKVEQYQTYYSFQGNSYFRTTGTFSQPNLLTVYLALIFPVILNLRFLKKKYLKIVSLISSLICIATPLLTLSRWGLLTIIFAFIFNIVLINRFIKINLKQIIKNFKVEILMFFVFSSILLVTRSDRFLNFSLNESNLISRTELILQSIYMIRQNPLLGVGGGNFTGFFLNYDITNSLVSERLLEPVHNFFLLLTAETGIPSLLILLTVIALISVFFYINCKKLLLSWQIITVGLFASFAAFFFNGLWTLRSFEDRAGFLFWLLLALLVNILTQKLGINKNKKPV